MKITKEIFEAAVPAFRDATEGVFRRMVPKIKMYERRTEEFAPFEELDELRTHYVCLAAAHDAVRSLDLVLTPSGFGVISTGDKSPASQARVDALHEQLYREASEAYDALRDRARTTTWNAGRAAHDMVDGLLFSPTLMRRYGVTCEGKDVYAREYARLAPERHAAAHFVRCELSPEMYDLLIETLEKGEDLSDFFAESRDGALARVLKRARELAAKVIRGGSATRETDNLRATLELFADVLPEYRTSATYKARHMERYRNEHEHPTFFFG